jgi:hypothetical protein
MQHVPGFIQSAEELKAKGVDEILVISGIILTNSPLNYADYSLGCLLVLKYLIVLFYKGWFIDKGSVLTKCKSKCWYLWAILV